MVVEKVIVSGSDDKNAIVHTNDDNVRVSKQLGKRESDTDIKGLPTYKANDFTFYILDDEEKTNLYYAWLFEGGNSYCVHDKYRTAVPRCYRRTYEVTYCEDCDDYYEEEYLFGIYISCCPAD